MAATGKPLVNDTAAKDTALVVAAHGSTLRPCSSRTTYLHAEEIRKRHIFAEVREGFLKQAPALDDVLANISAPKIRLVPFMASKGYVTDRIMPAKITRDGSATITEPVGAHPLILTTIRDKLCTFFNTVDAGDASVLVVGHGTKKNRAAADQLKTLAATLSKTAKAVFLEQKPLLKDWRKITDGGTVIVLPFFMSGGLHGTRDIPALLDLNPGGHGPSLAGLEESAKPAGPFELCGRKVYLFRPLGYEPVMAEIIIERALEN